MSPLDLAHRDFSRKSEVWCVVRSDRLTGYGDMLRYRVRLKETSRKRTSSHSFDQLTQERTPRTPGGDAGSGGLHSTLHSSATDDTRQSRLRVIVRYGYHRGRAARCARVQPPSPLSCKASCARTHTYGSRYYGAAIVTRVVPVVASRMTYSPGRRLGRAHSPPPSQRSW